MEFNLKKLREAFQEQKAQNPDSCLQDIIVNTQTGEYQFVWQEDEK